MIDPFEAALADLLADQVGPESVVQVVTRPRDGLEKLVGDKARVWVQVHDAALTEDVGGDEDERLGIRGDYRTRLSLRASGKVRISVEVGVANSPGDQAAQRGAVMRATDAVLVALHHPNVRSGTAFGDDHEQGFAIDGFRLSRIEHPEESADAFRRIDVWCDYRGRFWPVVPQAAGDIIADPIRTRMALLDPELPTGLRVASGAPDLVVSVRLDLRAWGGSSPRLAGRLAGAAPPGQLVGDPAGMPPGWVGFPVDADGASRVVFRPAAALATPAEARVRLALAGADQETVDIGELRIEVAA